MEYVYTIGEILRLQRVARRLSQQEVAARSGVSQRTVSYLESGQRTGGKALDKVLAILRSDFA